MSAPSVLTAGQQEDLHKAILDYLSSSGYTKTYVTFKEDLTPNLSGFEPDAAAKTAGLLVRKWNSVIRLQKKLVETERRLSDALEEISRLSRLGSTSSSKSPSEWLPGAPAKHELAGQGDIVNALSFHPVDFVLAVACRNSKIMLWDWDSGLLERTVRGHTREVTDVQYDSKGKNLVSASYGLFVKVWSVNEDYINTATLAGHEHSVSSARFMPDDDHIISSSRDETVRIWNLSTRHCIKVIRSHEAWICGAIPSLDGRLVLTCAHDHTARIIDVQSGITKAEFRGHEQNVEVAVFVPPIAVPAVCELVCENDPINAAFVATASRDQDNKDMARIHRAMLSDISRP